MSLGLFIVTLNVCSAQIWSNTCRKISPVKYEDVMLWEDKVDIIKIITSASKRSIRRFVITEKAPTRAFSWLKAATTAFTFKTLC